MEDKSGSKRGAVRHRRGLAVAPTFSFVSKIPQAVLVEDMLRMIGQNLLIAGIGVLISYELYCRNDDYSERQEVGHEDYPYHVIPDNGLFPRL